MQCRTMKLMLRELTWHLSSGRVQHISLQCACWPCPYMLASSKIHILENTHKTPTKLASIYWTIALLRANPLASWLRFVQEFPDLGFFLCYSNRVLSWLRCTPGMLKAHAPELLHIRCFDACQCVFHVPKINVFVFLIFPKFQIFQNLQKTHDS